MVLSPGSSLNVTINSHDKNLLLLWIRVELKILKSSLTMTAVRKKHVLGFLAPLFFCISLYKKSFSGLFLSRRSFMNVQIIIMISIYNYCESVWNFWVLWRLSEREIMYLVSYSGVDMNPKRPRTVTHSRAKGKKGVSIAGFLTLVILAIQVPWFIRSEERV